jgi:uncharacterized protein YbjT (DUF2867 family)
MRDEIISVIGGSGFLGRYVVKMLAAKGYRVRVLCRKPHLAEFLKPCGNVGQVVLDYIDLAKPETIQGKLEGSYGVINLVGLLFEGGSQKFVRVHAQGAERVAQEAAAAGASVLVHVSALGIDKAHKSAYARTKLEGEKAVKAAFADATILRPSVIFGAEDDFFNRFARMSQFPFPLPAVGGGETKFQPVFVDDVAKAVMVAIEEPKTAGKIYELGGPNVYAFKDLLRYVGEVTGRGRSLVNLPFSLASVMGAFAQFLPNPPITADQVTLLRTDNIVDEKALGFKALGIAPTALESVVPNYLAHRNRSAA